jgi:tight adherence protein B
VTGLLVALAGAYGVHLLYSALVLGWSGVAPGPGLGSATARRRRVRDWLTQAGLADVRPLELVAVVAALSVLGASVAFVVFGGPLPALAGGAFAGGFPVAAARARRERRWLEASTAWPRMIEEIRIQTTTLGRSVPQALFHVGRRAPHELRPAFEAAHREWLLTTDFDHTVGVLKSLLADPTADAVCETLLVAHQIGGTDVDRCLLALAEDRIIDVQGRKDARAHQAGARFARRFVIVVPLGMAVVGLSIGDGRSAYQTATGQSLILVGLALIGVCWVWAGRIMRLPEEERVFHG